MQHDNLRQAMKIAGRTPTWAARQMGMSRRTFFNRLDRGFSPDEQMRLAYLLNTDRAWLFAGSEDSVNAASVAEEVEVG